jgi:hypothetical protein
MSGEANQNIYQQQTSQVDYMKILINLFQNETSSANIDVGFELFEKIFRRIILKFL